jgi:hypothetical protein
MSCVDYAESRKEWKIQQTADVLETARRGKWMIGAGRLREQTALAFVGLSAKDF